MARWIEAAKLSDCPPGTAIERTIAGRIVAVFHVAGRVYATDGMCAHQGGPLGKGKLEGCIVTCPWHGWQYDVGTGQQQITPSIRVTTFPARIDNDRILVEIEEEEHTHP